VMDDDKIIAADIARDQFAPGATINTCLIPRQIWSVGKPWLYTLALTDLWRTPDTILHDETTMYSGGEGFYIPRNSTLQTHGDVKLSDALGSSLNIPAVETLSKVGISSYRSWLRRLDTLMWGQTTRNESPEEYGLSLALGTKAITPVDLTQMRSIFAQCSSLEKEKSWPTPSSHPWLASFCERYGKSLATISQVLSVNSFRRLTFPTYNRLDIPGVYAKTGTSRKFVDGRVCGGDGRYTVCVRVGNASGAPMKDSGYTTAGMLRHAVIERVRGG
jgi:penicillin-binding protein 1C